MTHHIPKGTPVGFGIQATLALNENVFAAAIGLENTTSTDKTQVLVSHFGTHAACNSSLHLALSRARSTLDVSFFLFLPLPPSLCCNPLL